MTMIIVNVGIPYSYYLKLKARAERKNTTIQKELRRILRKEVWN